MGLFDFLKKKPKQQYGRVYAPTMNGQTPYWSDFGEDIYASDIIMQAIRCKATEFKKLKPRHIRTTNGKQTVITDSSIARCLAEPNPYMTQSDFLEKVAILLELNKNVFIYPTYYITQGQEKYYTGLYPLKPLVAEYKIDQKGDLYIDFTFGNGYMVTLPANEVIHWRKDFGVDDYFGENFSKGQDKQLLKMLKSYDNMTQSIAKGLNVALSVNGIVKYKTYLSDEKLEQRHREFEEKLQRNESGLLAADLSTEFVNIPRDIKMVDADTLKFTYDTILRVTGTPLAILNGDYTKQQKEAYYEHSLEADIKSLGEAMTKVLFTEREKSYNNSIVLYPNSIVFMSMENKLSALQIGMPSGMFTKDEARELLGYPPLPNGQGELIPQGYNSLLDQNNNNKLNNEGSVSDDQSKEQPKPTDE